MNTDFINLTAENLSMSIYAALSVARNPIRALKQNSNGFPTD